MAMCPSMAWSTEKQWELEQEFTVQVVLDHIPGADSVVPDAQSLGRLEKALQGMREGDIGEPRRLELGKRSGCWLEDLVGAAGIKGAGRRFIGTSLRRWI